MSKQFDKFDLYIKKLISVAINDHIGKKKQKEEKISSIHLHQNGKLIWHLIMQNSW